MFSRRGLASDVRLATAAIRSVTGQDPRPWFRAPFGAVDKGTAVFEQLKALGYQHVGWHVDSRDWASRSAEPVARRIIDGVKQHGDGAIVLMHGWPSPNPDALPRVIDALRGLGATFVTVAALDDVPARAIWDNGPE
jgi:peptidoglycan/xylan/chitin deacetylase (PgdA/CDA1 family)